MTPEEIDQLAAARMRAAELHTALAAVLKASSGTVAELAATLDPARRVLEAGEPDVLTTMAAARDLIAIYRARKDMPEAGWGMSMTAAVEALARTLP